MNGIVGQGCYHVPEVSSPWHCLLCLLGLWLLEVWPRWHPCNQRVHYPRKQFPSSFIYFTDFICISSNLFSFPSATTGSHGGWGWSCLTVKLPPGYWFWLGLFGLDSAAQSWVSFRQLNKVFYFIQGGCIMPISGAIWWELGQKNVPWKWHPICSPMRKDHRISFSLTLLYSFNRV